MALTSVPFTILNDPPPPPQKRGRGRVSKLRAAIENLEVGQAVTLVVANSSDAASARTLAHLARKSTGRDFVTGLERLGEHDIRVTIWRTA